MFEILPRDWNLKPIFTQKWMSVDMNWEFNPPNPPTIPTLLYWRDERKYNENLHKTQKYKTRDRTRR